MVSTDREHSLRFEWKSMWVWIDPVYTVLHVWLFYYSVLIRQQPQHRVCAPEKWVIDVLA